MNKARATLVTIALLFLAPLVLALLMRSNWWDFKTAHLSNRGDLVAAGTLLPADAIRPASSESSPTRKHWTILYRAPSPCASDCRQTLVSLRQVHLASGRERDRVAIWLLHETMPAPGDRELLHSIYPEFEIYSDVGGASLRLLARLRGKDGGAFGEPAGQTFLLDPANHIILRYAPDFDPRDLSQDLDRLLTWTPDE